MRPKHTKWEQFAAYDKVPCRPIPVMGYRITKHFAVTIPPGNGRSKTQTWWAVTHIPTGACAVGNIKNRRVAEIVARVFEMQPVDWAKLPKPLDGRWSSEAVRELAHIRWEVARWVCSLDGALL